MIRATHGVHNGAYYWECQILQSVDINAHVRLGWSTRQGELQAPVGYDKYSFAYGDIKGYSNPNPNLKSSPTTTAAIVNINDSNPFSPDPDPMVTPPSMPLIYGYYVAIDALVTVTVTIIFIFILKFDKVSSLLRKQKP